MTRRLSVMLATTFVLTTLAACGSDNDGPTASGARQSTTASQSVGSEAAGDAKGGRIFACSVQIDYTFRLQNGTIGSTSSYAQSFTVSAAAPYSDDQSTVTRAKIFDASVVPGKQPTINMSFFHDVSTFNNIDLSGMLQLDSNLASKTTNGRNTFSTSLPGANGHHETSYSLTCAKQ